MINVPAIRHETAGCHPKVIFLSNAGSSLQPDVVFETIRNYQELERRVGGYEAADRMSNAIEAMYDTIASHLGCCRSEIALVENATRAWQSIVSAIPFQSGDVVITSQSEYHSNYIALLQLQQRIGIEIKIIPNSNAGELCLATLERSLDDRVKLVTLPHVASNNAMVNNAAAVGAVVGRFPALYLLDACQSAGQMPLNVADLRCDFLVASGRKFLRGPRGTGFLYAKKTAHRGLQPNFLDGLAADWCDTHSFAVRTDARKFETWEKNYALFLGLASAVAYADKIGMENIWQRIQSLAELTRKMLRRIPGVHVRDSGRIKSGIISFTIDGVAPELGYKEFAKQNVFLGYTGVRSTRLDMQERNLECLYRASVHYFNTVAELRSFAEVVRALALESSKTESSKQAQPVPQGTTSKNEIQLRPRTRGTWASKPEYFLKNHSVTRYRRA